jgi:hypothetical protein
MAAEDPLLDLLQSDDYEQARPAILRELKRPDVAPCVALGGYAGHRDERVRENSVRALADAGCADFDSYRGFLADARPWVIEAVLRAAGRHRITAAVPFLIDRLEDRRRIVSGEGSWTIGDTALVALRAVTCQPITFDPRGTPEERASAIAAWREWHTAHGREPRAAWIESGVARAHLLASGDDPARRLEALRLLALLGPDGEPALRAVLRRGPGDLGVTVGCEPEEPPRVTDRVPCVIEVTNRSGRRLALSVAPGEPEVRLTRGEPGSGPPPGRSPEPPPADPAEVARHLVDLAPGERLRREFRVGPVAAAGRYGVRATLVDLAGTSADGPLRAETVVRFEQ